MRINEPKTTALIFRTGKMVLMGAKAVNDAKLAGRKFAKILIKVGFKVRFLDFKVCNMVGSVDVNFPVNLQEMKLRHNLFSDYEPERFPGLIYRMLAPKVVVLAFITGKIILTGAKSRDDLVKAFDQIYPVLQDFRKV
jgi:transcription initiation factor TFIID TATA-box-binding protein